MNLPSFSDVIQRGMTASCVEGLSRAERLWLWSYRVTRWALAAVFIGSGIVKLADPEAFAVIVDAYGWLPPALVGLTALLLPALELAAGIGLVFDARGSLGLIAALTVLFIAILGYGIHMGLDVDCGCFGPQDPEADAFHGLRTALYRDLLLLAAILHLYAWRLFRKAPGQRQRNGTGTEHTKQPPFKR